MHRTPQYGTVVTQQKVYGSWVRFSYLNNFGEAIDVDKCFPCTSASRYYKWYFLIERYKFVLTFNK